MTLFEHIVFLVKIATIFVWSITGSMAKNTAPLGQKAQIIFKFTTKTIS